MKVRLLIMGLALLVLAIALVDTGRTRFAASEHNAANSDAASQPLPTSKQILATDTASVLPRPQPTIRATNAETTSKNKPRHVPAVDLESIARYMARASMNARAKASVEAGMDVEAAKKNITIERSVDCRGAVCQIVMTFPDSKELAKVAGSRPESGEFTYEIKYPEERGQGPIVMTVFITSPGVTFAELLS